MKRRAFLYWATFGAMIGTFFFCHAPSYSQNQTKSELEFYSVGTVDELHKKGFLLNEDLEIGAVLVIFAEDGSIIALDPTCTHAGCLVEWNSQNKALVCPCHGSKFTQTGELIDGLAKTNLTKYQVKIQDNIIFVATY